MSEPEVRLVLGQELLEYKESIIQLFIDTFTAAPRYESWAKEEVSEYLIPIFQFGFASLYIHDEVLIGFSTFLPIKCCHIKNDIHHLLGVQEGYYFSDATVRLSERGKGIGTALLSCSLNHIFALNYEICVARTRVDALAMRHLLEKFGFTQEASYYSSIHGSDSERLLYVSFPQERDA